MKNMTSTSVRAFFICAALLCVFSPARSTERIMFASGAYETIRDAFADGWTTWSQRPETEPVFLVAPAPGRSAFGCLAVSGASKSHAHGAWTRDVTVSGGRWYRLEASCRTERAAGERWKVFARLDWRKGDGDRTGQPEYVPDAPGGDDGWRRLAGTFRAPDDAVSARIELHQGFSPQGRTFWDGISLAGVDEPPARVVRVATVNCVPRGNTAGAESVEEFVSVAAEAGRRGADIVCLGEGINLVGVAGKAYPDIAEPIPGPATRRLGEVAREWNMYIVAALGERDGPAVFNTAVLIGRDGVVKGIYRKVHLPREEIEAGVMPGNAWPVFETDFGTIGMMICWDVQYAEPARALAFQGAEILFLFIWGGNEILTRARAIENQVHVVSCGYGIASTIYDPWGNLLAEAKDRPGVTLADIDLSEKHPDPWLGDMRERFFRELRVDIPVPGLD